MSGKGKVKGLPGQVKLKPAVLTQFLTDKMSLHTSLLNSPLSSAVSVETVIDGKV